MKMIRVNQGEANTIFGELAQKYKIIAPTRKINGGRFSNSDLWAYDEVRSFEEIEFSKKTYFSAKEVLFPIRQSLFEFQKKRVHEVIEDSSPRIIFLRACDIHAIRIMDAHFLDNGKYKDVYYKRRRESIKIFLMECKKPFENCFCVSMGTNKTDDYSAFMRKTDHGYEIKVKDNELLEYLSVGEEKETEPVFVEKDTLAINLPEEIDVSLFENEMWKEYSKRCTACGRCTAACPTCTCFTLQDIPSENREDTSERRRIWSSCQVKNFSILAGNHDFRILKGDRMRYKVLHKIRDFRKITGFNMCVGCGRCDDVCPEYISMFKCVEKINHVMDREKRNG